MKRWLSVSAALLAGLAGAQAMAHHSFAMFDFKKMVTIEGTVREFVWTNPHSTLWVVVPNKAGAQTWAIEMTSPGNLVRLGIAKRAFNPGDRVRVDVHPLRSGSTGGSFQGATLLATGQRIVLPDNYRETLGRPDQ